MHIFTQLFQYIFIAKYRISRKQLVFTQRATYMYRWPLMGNSQAPAPQVCLDIMYETQLKSVKQHKYLGVWINEKLSWQTHILCTCNKANRTLRFLQRNLRICPTYLKEQAYKQLVLPVLEYCAPIWDLSCDNWSPQNQSPRTS